MKINNNIIDKALGAYLGFAIGDALGATTEFMNENEIKHTYGVHRKIIGGGWLHLEAGNITDDTQMCLYLGNSIIDNNGFDEKKVAIYFLNWMKSKPIDIGHTVRRGLVNFRKTGHCEVPYSEYAAGNGACMRNLPIILYCLKNWNNFRDLTIKQCHITHNNKHSDAITIAFGEITKILIETSDKEKAYNFVINFIDKHPKYNFLNYRGENSGYVVDTFKIVMHYFFNNNTFYDILLPIVNKGGDCDTNGALAGMLAGALYGRKGLYKGWLKKIKKEIKRDIE
ncbi:MAG: ADP-ribosyl-[dinitrogen reductase] hydrolase, partial [Deferribacterota bacterium]|nr:ADP-ribosyl-[dinitrogen reductase] hydrolase [Deferribacterota bacterium]